MWCQLKGTVFRRPAADDLSSQLRLYAANSILLNHTDHRQRSTPNHSWQTCKHRHSPFPKLTLTQSLCLCFLKWREGTIPCPGVSYILDVDYNVTMQSMRSQNTCYSGPMLVTYASYLISVMLYSVLAVTLTGLRPPTSLSRGPASIRLSGCYVCYVLIYDERRSIFLMPWVFSCQLESLRCFAA